MLRRGGWNNSYKQALALHTDFYNQVASKLESLVWKTGDSIFSEFPNEKKEKLILSIYVALKDPPM